MSEPVTEQSLRKAWVKNTYFWIAAILLFLAILGLVRGDGAIRDPGQRHENMLWAIYLVASVVMFVNGYISHQTWLKHMRSAIQSSDKSQ